MSICTSRRITKSFQRGHFTRDVSFLEVKQSGYEKITGHVIPIEYSGANYASVALSLFKPVSQLI